MGGPLRVQGRRPQAPVASWGCVTKHHRGAAPLGAHSSGGRVLGEGGEGQPDPAAGALPAHLSGLLVHVRAWPQSPQLLLCHVAPVRFPGPRQGTGVAPKSRMTSRRDPQTNYTQKDSASK